MVGEHRDTQFGRNAFARSGVGIDDTDQVAMLDSRIFLGVEAAQVAGADHGTTQSLYRQDRRSRFQRLRRRYSRRILRIAAA